MDFEHEFPSESALLLRFGECIDQALSERVHAVFHALRSSPLAGVDDLIPAYASLLLRFDPKFWGDVGDGEPHEALLAAVRETVATHESACNARWEDGRLHTLPVCYGGEHGQDLEAVADQVGLSPEELVARHCAVEYRVAMLGFAPGFAYLLGLDPLLHVPRRDRPRTRVPAGSVAIGGAQTGIYPRELPGGWQLIGRTPMTLFDADNSKRPSLLLPADRVRFAPIDAADFEDGAGETTDARSA